MSWITDYRQLSGTCYIEVLPGKFQNQHWNPESVFFCEEHFGLIERIIARHFKDYDHFGFSDIDRASWLSIVSDLDEIVGAPLETSSGSSADSSEPLARKSPNPCKGPSLTSVPGFERRSIRMIQSRC